MRTIHILVSACLLAAPVAAGAATPQQMETSVWQAFKTKNATAFRAMFTPNYVGLYEDGRASLANELDHLKNGNIRSFSISNFGARSVDASDVLTTYVVDVRGSIGKTDISGKYYAASLWHRSGNKWQTAYHTEIKAK
jgi:hypothetical protein